MAPPGLVGQAQTVLGPIAGDAMGITLPHEHLLVDFAVIPYNPAFDMPDDGERMRQILFLIEHGHLPQILMSHDIACKHCLTKWGGFGYRRDPHVPLPVPRGHPAQGPVAR
jgi:predicted metal-dependent phosphotriesterase family hydrolase